MKISKIIALLTAVIMCVVCLAGCGNDKNSAQNISGGDGSAVIATVNGRDITVDEYRFFVNQAALSVFYSLNSDFTGDFSTVDWGQKTSDGKSVEEVIKEKSLIDAENYASLAQYGIENGMEVSPDVFEQIDSSIEQFITENGEDMLMKNLGSMGISSVDGYKKLSKLLETYGVVEADFSQNRDKYIKDEKQMQSFGDTEYVNVQHILIMNDSENHENPEAVIKDVQKRAKSGEDFSALMTEFNEDPGQSPAGYSFGKGEMAIEFEEAAFALDYDEISDVVKTEYGYHIIKRVPGLCEYINYLRSNAEITVNEEILAEISIRDTVMDSFNFIKELNEMEGGNANG